MLITEFITCPNAARDGFTVSTDSGGNGALTYPIGLLTADEVMLVGGSDTNSSRNSYLYTGQRYLSLSPYGFNYYYTSEFFVDYDGYLDNYYDFYSYGVRPAISLKKGAKAIDGDGTVENPYVVE